MKKSVLIAGAQKKSLQTAKKPLADSSFWRRVWDSNPREIALKLISNQPRYDHFDNPP